MLRRLRRPAFGGPGAGGAALAPVELPELDNGPHFFYGLQWWFFGVLALFGFGYLAWDERRKRPGAGERDDVSEDENAAT